MATIQTDTNGQFEFLDVAPGDYELLISSSGPKVKLRVRLGRTLEVRLMWKAWPERVPCL